MPDRVVSFRARTVLGVVVIVVAVWELLHALSATRPVVVWFLISLFLALAINPLVEWFMRRGLKRRGTAASAAFLLVLIAFAAIGATFIPTLVDNVTKFVDHVPNYVDHLTKGKGRLGFLETKYHVVEKVRSYLHTNGAKKLFGLTGTAISVTKGVLSFVVGALTVAFLTFFMLIEGPAWMDRLYGLLPPDQQPRWRKVGHDIYRQVGGYVTGNLAISVIAGSLSTLVLLLMGVPYAVALGLIVAILDLIPLAGATIAAVIIVSVSALHSILAGVVVLVFFVIYQQVENQILQPVVYNRTVALSPLAILLSVLIGAQLAGIIGALAAIPVGGAIQVLITDFQRARRERKAASPATT